MKKIVFGYSNCENPTGLWDGPGLQEGSLIYSADYYGAISFCEETYIIAKIVSDPNNCYPELLNSFVAIKALFDLKPNGKGHLYLSDEFGFSAMKLSELVNKLNENNKIESVEDIVESNDGIKEAPTVFKLVEQDEKIIACVIPRNKFKEKMHLLKQCGDCSFTELQKRLNEDENVRK